MKLTKFLLALTAIIMFSCADDIEIQENFNTNELTTFSQNPTYMDVEAIYIDNGTPQNCEFNMLVFESVNHYTQVLEALEELIEAHEDNFVSQYDNLNEDDLNHVEEQIGHNEYLPLIQFEQELGFCSLRQVVSVWQEDWLESQPENDIDFSDDPDDWFTFAEDDAERTLLNIYGEVVIDRTLYKFTNEGFYEINLNSPNLTDILNRINNNGESPEEIVRTFGSEVSYETQAQSHPDPCLTNLKKSKKLIIDDRRIKMKHRLYTGTFNRTAMSKTVGYKKRGSKWKRRRMRISAGFRGTISSPNQFCNEEVNFDVQRSVKKRRTRKYAKRLSRSNYPNNWKISYHELGTWHSIEGNEHIEPLPYN